jgi:hypothetical protein
VTGSPGKGLPVTLLSTPADKNRSPLAPVRRAPPCRRSSRSEAPKPRARRRSPGRCAHEDLPSACVSPPSASLSGRASGGSHTGGSRSAKRRLMEGDERRVTGLFYRPLHEASAKGKDATVAVAVQQDGKIVAASRGRVSASRSARGGGADSVTTGKRPEQPRAPPSTTQAGGMFWFSRKRLFGS